jgi:hypothetical protein
VSGYDIKKAGSSRTFDDWRFGLGTGLALYIGDQMDYAITMKYGEFHELRPNLTFTGYKQIKSDLDWGLVLKVGSFQTLKSNNTQGIQCNYQEIQSNWQKSLNDNVNMASIKNRLTVNLQYGFGLIYYKSKYFTLDPKNLKIDASQIYSSVGYGLEPITDSKGISINNIPKKRVAIIGNLGFNFGYRITKHFSFFWENTLQVSASNKLSGNLDKVAKIPPDCYYYSGISIFYKFGVGGGRLACSKFQF